MYTNTLKGRDVLSKAQCLAVLNDAKPMETKREAFVRLANKRVYKGLHEFRKVGTLFKNRQAYEATAADVDAIIQRLQMVIDDISRYKDRIQQH